MAYHKTISLAGNSAKGLELLRNLFIYQGFQLTELTSTGFKAKNQMPVLKRFIAMQHNSFMAISHVEVEAAGGTLTLDASLGGLTGVVVFLAIIMLVMATDVLISVLGPRGKSPVPEGLLIAPVMLLILWGPVSFRKRIMTRLDTLTANAAMIAEFKG